jgi:hypothetical protein
MGLIHLSWSGPTAPARAERRDQLLRIAGNGEIGGEMSADGGGIGMT